MTEIGIICIGAAMWLAFIAAVIVARQFLFVGRPNELLIFSGREYTAADGKTRGYRVIHGGFAWRVPMLEKVDQMSLTTMPIELNVSNAYSKGGIPLTLHAIANVKVSSDPNRFGSAIERFLGRDPQEIRQVAKETLEGHLRGIIARMTPEEVNEDRLKFAQELVEEAGEDFDRLGLTLDTLKVQMVSDEVQYLDSIGRERLANVLRDAEMAESSAKADAEAAQADYAQQGQVANEQAETMIRQRENGLRQRKAELEALAKSEEERAEQGALAARARAEQLLQEIRAKLEHLRLSSDVVLPAEAQRQASEMAARAGAAQIAADGQALAEVLEMMRGAWVNAGPDAKDIFLIQQLEKLLSTVTEKVKGMQIGEVHLIDGGKGTALPQHMAALPATVGAVLREFRETTGVDITGILAGNDRRGDSPDDDEARRRRQTQGRATAAREVG